MPSFSEDFLSFKLSFVTFKSSGLIADGEFDGDLGGVVTMASGAGGGGSGLIQIFGSFVLPLSSGIEPCSEGLDFEH